ncbi:MAG TPA: hypothetical protein VKV74_06700 [Bryobacteraceae bacterium]|nr:hypothetical protein [Bryobacteraceae bacterium]
MAEDGDWVEGEPKWWWKYVIPAEIRFWSGILQQQGAMPEQWEKITGEILEGLAMVQAAVKVGDPQIRGRLHQEGVAKVSAGAHALAKTKAAGE